ncbi:MAG TPA: flagellar biosynthetic protein FliO [Deltaproteobacteria bacterium]|nr:flagellar biosynthetic protein FliO [Deltaproteobacteria bacterium]HPJ95355.1 flagellar biosynthetic protein FliO [Deltaproteobacteria bacterium]HPR50683.1 flagellar biosynthetic protein FliO [Deltaproteobacteria bacterium]
MKKTGQCPLIIACMSLMASPVLASDSEVTGISLQAIFILIIIICGLFALAWALKKYGPVARVKKSLGLDVLGQVALNTKANLALVRVGKSILLVGVTQNNISLIKDLEQGEFEKAIDEFSTAPGGN